MRVIRFRHFKARMRRGFSWTTDHPAAVLGFGLGLACGIVLRIPLFPWILSDGASSVFAAAAGALIGAGGAGFVAVGIATRSDRRARELVIDTLSRISQRALAIAFRLKERGLLVRDAAAALCEFETDLRVLGENLDLLKSSDRYIEVAGLPIVEAISHIRVLISFVGPACDTAQARRKEDPLDPYGANARLLEDLDAFAVGIQKIVDFLS